MGETGVCKKGMKRSKRGEFEQDHQFKLTRNPKPFDDSAFREKKVKISELLVLETAKTGRVFNTKQESKC